MSASSIGEDNHSNQSRVSHGIPVRTAESSQLRLDNFDTRPGSHNTTVISRGDMATVCYCYKGKAKQRGEKGALIISDRKNDNNMARSL